METPTVVLKRCEARWSEQSQLLALSEESAELAAAVARFQNGKCGIDDVMNEAADVSIMLDQFIRRWGVDFKHSKRLKLRKLVTRLDALDSADRSKFEGM